jgi:hypothetical protein
MRTNILRKKSFTVAATRTNKNTSTNSSRNYSIVNSSVDDAVSDALLRHSNEDLREELDNLPGFNEFNREKDRLSNPNDY